MIPYGRQNIGNEEKKAVESVLNTNWLTQGSKVPEFEKALTDFCGSNYAVAVANGTAALHLACLALGLGEGDRLWTSPISFVASANCARYCGAEVDFVDIDFETRNMGIESLREKLEWAKRENVLPKILVAVHFAGLSCDMKSIKILSEQYGFYIIEDAAHAIGSHYEMSPVGSCAYSDLTIFSFHPVKNMTTAEGGAVTCNTSNLVRNLKLYRSHGISKCGGESGDPLFEPWVYQQHQLGFNYRLSDVHAAIGIVQLRRLPDFIKKRKYLVSRYNKLLKNLPIQLSKQETTMNTAWHLYVIQLPSSEIRRRVYDYFIQKEIIVNVHYLPIHLQPYYQNLGFQKGDFPNAEFYYSGALTLPLYFDLSEFEQDLVVQTLEDALQCA